MTSQLDIECHDCGRSLWSRTVEHYDWVLPGRCECGKSQWRVRINPPKRPAKGPTSDRPHYVNHPEGD